MASVRSDVPIRIGPFLEIRVNIETAVEAESSFHNVCDQGHDAVRVRAPMTCPSCGATSGFRKGREVADKLVVLDADELADTAVDEDLKKGMTLTVHPREEVISRTVPSAAAYYLTAGKTCTAGAYGLLLGLLRANPDKAFCTVFAAKGKPAMYRLEEFGDVLTLQKLAWPSDLKAVPAVPIEFDLTYLGMAQTLVDTLVTPFDPDLYADTQRAAREALVASKLDDAPPLQPLPDNVPANVSTGLLAALQASLQATGDTAPAPAKKSTTSRRKKASA